MPKNVRTRFAPSPTGFIHIGNIRTALYAYLMAKKHGGTFVLRLEDTDQGRYVPEAVELIYRTLKYVGLTYQEGPDIGGNYGPYVQSQRLDIYKKHIEELIAKGGAYRCFCSKERLEELRKGQEEAHQPTKYDGLCKKLTPEEVAANLKADKPYVVRQLIPLGRTVSFHDEVFGDISVSSDDLEEGVLMKSDGFPTYNFANVVDDHLMEISHVIRGTEYLSSTPKYVLIYEALGWTPPTHMHLPPIMKTATKKFSKREGDASFIDLIERGYLKDAVVNAIALLGWHPEGDRELFTLAELEQEFSESRLQKAPAIFDLQKLDWMNREYLKKMSVPDFEKLAAPFLDRANLPSRLSRTKVAALLKDRITTLAEIPTVAQFLVALSEYDAALFSHQKSKATPETSRQAVKWFADSLPKLQNFDDEAGIRAFFDQGIAETGLTTGQLLWAARVALSGQQFTPGGAVEILAILGPEEAKRRLEVALGKLK